MHVLVPFSKVKASRFWDFIGYAAMGMGWPGREHCKGDAGTAARYPSANRLGVSWLVPTGAWPTRASQKLTTNNVAIETDWVKMAIGSWPGHVRDGGVGKGGRMTGLC
jgi:hypothetical protein